MSEQLRKRLFKITVFINFIMVFIYEYLTPTMSDDIVYADKVAEAKSFFDLFAQEYEHYMGHIGRSVAHIILRIFLYCGNKIVFDIGAAVVFVLISLLIYANIDHKKAGDIRIYTAISVLMWLFDPTIANSVFWETGACNYMFTGCIMLGFVTLLRKAVRENWKKGIGFSIGIFFFGLAAGWCNENTSGGVILFILLMILWKWYENKNFSAVRSYMVTGLIGAVIGFITMIASPGNRSRAEVTEEAHTGLLALMARFLKITINIKDYYLILVFVYVVIAIAIAYRTGNKKKFFESAAGMLLFGFLFLATVYALIAVPDSHIRTYYGASLFLMTAIVSGFAWIANEGFKEDLVQIMATSLVTLFGIFLIFTYVTEGANLARIKREFNERDAYLAEMAKGEEMVIEAPMLRPNWKTRFSAAYEADITEDKFNWLNMFYSEHYGLWYIIGVDRESWTVY